MDINDPGGDIKTQILSAPSDDAKAEQGATGLAVSNEDQRTGYFDDVERKEHSVIGRCGHSVAFLLRADSQAPEIQTMSRVVAGLRCAACCASAWEMR